MKIKHTIAISAIALLMATTSAQAETRYAKDKPATATEQAAPSKTDSTLESVKGGLRKADANIRETADDIKAFIVGEKDKGTTFKPVKIRHNVTAEGMLGETIVTTKGESIAEVKDIIINKSGHASKVIVSDGGLLGIGDKVAAFDYGSVITQKKNGEVVMAINEKMIDKANDFSYDRDDYQDAEVLKTNSVSVNKALDAHVYDSAGNQVADVENISFTNGKADQLIVSFNKKLGMGGDLAALDYNALKAERGEDGAVKFRLSEAQSNRFDQFKKAMADKN